MPIFVVKASGERQPFDVEKIRKTCERAGADKKLAAQVAAVVEKKAYDGISTKEILKLILRELEKAEPYVAARYDLKGAIMRLGPAGFVFEELISELLEAYGYKTKVDTVVRGGCVSHEIDVIAEKKGELVAIEAKYHNAPGIYTGVKDALYVWARYLDLRDGAKKGTCPDFNSIWLVTNTKFSSDATDYAECKKMKLLGWRYPLKGGLQDMLEEKRLYPITVLRTLDPDSLGKLAAANMMFCKDLAEMGVEELQKKTRIGEKKLRALQEEAALVWKGG
jgi:hypothetical protein